MEILYIDFEFRNPDKEEEIILLSWMDSVEKCPSTIDLRCAERRREFGNWFHQYQNHVLIGYNIQAELRCLIALGVDIRDVKVIDLMTESRMISLTHSKYRSYKGSLLEALKNFNVRHDFSNTEKDEVRNLILRCRDYSESEWQQILEYGPKDIEPLPDLLKKVCFLHKRECTPVLIAHMLARGEYIKSLVRLSVDSLGFPLEVDELRGVTTNRSSVVRYLQMQVNETYGTIYQDKVQDKPMVWNNRAFLRLVHKRRISWPQNANGSGLDLTKKTFKLKAQRYPELEFLRQVRKFCRSFSSLDAAIFSSETGYIKHPIFPFSQRTGRDSPKPSKGFVMNMDPWLRTYIRPKNGMVFICADWMQQEIGIAAALSGDPNYIDLYDNCDGDVYLSLAKKAGAVPKNGTKESHGTERKVFKTVQLGLGYGKGTKALGEDLRELSFEDGDYSLSERDALNRAIEIVHWHKNTFGIYWDWVEAEIRTARRRGYIQSVDGWTYFVDKKVKKTQLLNFPMQANGAAMMRRALIHCDRVQSLDVVCTLHDAFYINSRVDEAQKAIDTLLECMNLGCQEILNNVLNIRIDTSTYDNESGYQDQRGQVVRSKIEEIMKKVS